MSRSQYQRTIPAGATVRVDDLTGNGIAGIYTTQTGSTLVSATSTPGTTLTLWLDSDVTFKARVTVVPTGDRPYLLDTLVNKSGKIVVPVDTVSLTAEVDRATAAEDSKIDKAISPQVQALALTPVMTTPLTVTAQAGSGGLEFATSTITGTLVDPSWKPTTTYPAGAQVLHPTDVKTVIRRVASGASAATFDTAEAAKWAVLPLGAQATFPMRWNCGFLYRKTLQGTCYGPRAPKQVGDAQETDSEIKGVQWSYDFDWYTVAGALEIPVYHTGQVRLVVDGKYSSAAPVIGAGGFQWQNIKFSGVAAGFHRVRVEIAGQWCWTGGVKIATADRVFPPSLPASKKFVIVSDSYGEGLTGVANSGTAIQDVRAYPYLLAKILGFTDYVGSAIGQTGFTVLANKTYMDRLADIIALQPEYLLIQGSGNDSPNRDTTMGPAALAFFQAVKAGCPKTKIVATGVPGWTVSQTIADAMTATLRTQATAAGIDFIDTTGWAASAASVLAADNNHPSYAGSEYLAWRFAAALAALWRLHV